MALWCADQEMAGRGVGLTLLAHNSELNYISRTTFDGQGLLFDSLGPSIFGAFAAPRSTIVPPDAHISWGAAHPNDIVDKAYTLGYPSKSYAYEVPLP